MKIFSMFTGVGGFELGIQRALDNRQLQHETAADSAHSKTELPVWECIGFSEIDKYASAVLQKQFPEVHNYGNAKNINAERLPDFDLLVGGFPCQAFSTAGNRRGFEDTRGTLFFEIARIAKQKQPRLLLLENVKGLLSHDKGRTFFTILSTLDELGYDVEWQVLNSKNHGVPQNRERVFIIGRVRGSGGRKIFPFGTENKSDSRSVGKDVSTCLDSNYHKGTSPGDLHKQRRQHVMLVMNPDMSNKSQNGRRVKGTEEPSFTLTAQDRHGVLCHCTQKRSPDRPSLKKNPKAGGSGHIYKEEEAYCMDTGNNMAVPCCTAIRRLTPVECERLQGFPDDWTKYGVLDGEVKLMSDTQRYKMMGNAVTVNVVQDIMQALISNE